MGYGTRYEPPPHTEKPRPSAKPEKEPKEKKEKAVKEKKEAGPGAAPREEEEEEEPETRAAEVAAPNLQRKRSYSARRGQVLDHS